MPAVAVKLADVELAATVTEAGTDKAVVLLDKATEAPPEPAACDSVTVQVVDPPELRLVALHVSWLTVVGATREIDAVCELPLKDAVTTAV